MMSCILALSETGMIKKKISILLIMFFGWAHVFADGNISLLIEEISKKIEKQPQNAELYFRRGEFQRSHGQWMMALADFDEARRINPKMIETDLAKGETLFKADQLKAAKLSLDRYLSKKPDHEWGLMIRGKVLMGLGMYQSSAEDFTQAIANGGSLKVDYYFERAQAFLAMNPKNYKEALKGLDEGIQKIGPLVVLETLAIDCEVELKLWESALQRVDLLANQAARKDGWLARKGEILQLAGKNKEAREAYEACLKALESLPPYRRQIPVTLEIENRVKTALNSLNQNSKL